MLDVLVVDDDDMVRECIARSLAEAGHRVNQASDGEKALSMLASKPFELVVCDVQMPKVDGLTLFRKLRQQSPGIAVVIMTSFGKIPDVVGSLRDGAVDYVTKPFDPDVFADTVVSRIADRRALMRRFEEARTAFVGRASGASLVCLSPGMRQLMTRMDVIATSDAPVVISGEGGTGKKLVARALHVRSARREGPFVVIPCATLNERMVESELRELSELRERNGRDQWFRAAEGGTLVLDGLEKLPATGQASLLRVLDEPSTQAKRSRDWKPLGVRVIALTRDDPRALIADGRLIEPLFFRLSTTQLRVPRLQERGDDLCELACQLLRELTPPSRVPPTLSPQAWKAITSYDFPGNVRELAWALEHAAAASRGEEVALADLPERVSRTPAA